MKYKKLWSICLLVISMVTLTIVGTRMLGIVLPDMVTRILGIIDLIAIPVLVYSSVKKKQDK